MEQYDVTVDRDRYIGGSDIQAIMGISPFKTRWQLLLEKAGLEEIDFSGNRYTRYGNVIEPQIREYINHLYFTNFEPNCVIVGDFRGHTDGFDGETVLEIKSTSTIYDDVLSYKKYLVQLIKYMEINNVPRGILAVYHRPEDLDPVFDSERLQIWEIDMQRYEFLLDEVNAELDRFRVDLKRLKENPLLSEDDFQPNELITISNKLLAFENQLAQYKVIERQYADMKQQLYEAMVKHNVKSWETFNGAKITRVDEIPATVETVQMFDENEFAAENTDLYLTYLKEVEKKKPGRAGYVKILMPKLNH